MRVLPLPAHSQKHSSSNQLYLDIQMTGTKIEGKTLHPDGTSSEINQLVSKKLVLATSNGDAWDKDAWPLRIAATDLHTKSSAPHAARDLSCVATELACGGTHDVVSASADLVQNLCLVCPQTSSGGSCIRHGRKQAAAQSQISYETAAEYLDAELLGH